MGIVYSTFAPTAVRLAYICQKLFDPKYSCIEDVPVPASSNNIQEVSATDCTQQQQQQQQIQIQSHTAKVELQTQSKSSHQECSSSLLPSFESRILAVKSNSLPRYSSKSPEYNHSLHQQNRNRRARQIRFKTRPSSFDGALIIRAKTKNAVILTSTPSPLSRHWDVTSSSGCSSDSNSSSDSDSETELRVSNNTINEETTPTTAANEPKFTITAEDEEAFRLTLGRGHFTRSKKDRFLNNLRLQKQSIYHHHMRQPSTGSSLW